LGGEALAWPLRAGLLPFMISVTLLNGRVQDIEVIQGMPMRSEFLGFAYVGMSYVAELREVNNLIGIY